MLNFLILYFFIGVIGGILIGLIGGGIGPLVVPVLIYTLPFIGIEHKVLPHVVISTSLAIVCITTAAGLIGHYLNRTIEWKLFYKLLPGSIVGAILGVSILPTLTVNNLKYIFGLFLIYLGIKEFLLHSKDFNIEFNLNLVKGYKVFLVTAFFALVSTLLGICEGLLLVPYMRNYGLSINRIVGASLFCSLLVSVIGLIPIFYSQMDRAHLPANTIDFIYLPAFIAVSGTSIIFAVLSGYYAKKISENITKRIFAICSFIIGMRMILG